jgi:hypothetical protein
VQINNINNLGRFIGSYEFNGVTKIVTISGVKKLKLVSIFEFDLMTNLYISNQKRLKRRSLQLEGPPFTGLEVTYLLRINFCSAWICLLIDAINETIDFRTSAFETVAVEALTVKPAVTAA